MRSLDQVLIVDPSEHLFPSDRAFESSKQRVDFIKENKLRIEAFLFSLRDNEDETIICRANLLGEHLDTFNRGVDKKSSDSSRAGI